MSNVFKYNYTNIEIPYNSLLERGGEGVESGSVGMETEGQPESPNDMGANILDGGSFNDLWIDSWIKSRSYKPKTHGFLIDGRLGYIECMKLYVGSGGIVGGSLSVPDDVSANSWHVDATGNMWSGCNLEDFNTDNDNADAYILNSGVSKFQNLTVEGGSIIGSVITGGTLQTATSGERVVITGNDMYLYDATTGGGGTITGDVSSIYFPRTDNSSMRFVLQKRASANNDTGNVMEMFYNEAAPSGRYNYLFIGNPGAVAEENWYTDVVNIEASTGFQFATESRNNATNGFDEFQIYNNDFPALGFTIEDNASRIFIAGNQSAAASPLNIVDGTGGGAIIMGVGTAGGFGALMWLDSAGIWIANDTIKSYTDGASNLGDANHGFGNMYVNDIYPSTTSYVKVHDDLVPSTDNTFDLGNSSYGWGQLYLGSGGRFLEDNGGELYFNNSPVGGSGTVTSIATSGAITGGTITTSGTIGHSTSSGYKHIPSGGSTQKFLKYSSDGTPTWEYLGATANAQTIIPTSSTANLGSSSYYWDNVYTGNVFVEDLYDRSQGYIDCHQDFRPSSNGSYDLGSSSYYWDIVYTEKVNLKPQAANPSSQGDIVCYDNGVTEQFRGRPSGSFSGSFDMSAY